MKGPPFPLAAGGQRHTLPPCEKEGGAQPGSRGDSQKLRFWCPSRYALRLPLTSTLELSKDVLMAEIPADQVDVEPEEPLTPKQGEVVKGKSGRRSFSKLRRELSDEELASPAVQKMLVDEIERLEEERVELHTFRTKFHDSDKRAAVLEEKFKGKISIEVIHIGCMTVGAAALGYAPSIWEVQPTAWMIAIFGVVLVLAGIGAKAVKP